MPSMSKRCTGSGLAEVMASKTCRIASDRPKVFGWIVVEVMGFSFQALAQRALALNLRLKSWSHSLESRNAMHATRSASGRRTAGSTVPGWGGHAISVHVFGTDTKRVFAVAWPNRPLPKSQRRRWCRPRAHQALSRSAGFVDQHSS